MNFARNRTSAGLLLSLSVLLAYLPAHADYMGPEGNQKVAFLGDSITQFGEEPTGYVSLVADALKNIGKPIDVIPAGVSGNTSKDMLARLDRDVLSKKPQWMTLSCGVNDVWHGATGVDLPDFETNITSIVDQANAAGIKVVILTATMIHEDPNDPLNQKLIPYNEFLKKLASQRHLLLADLNAAMQAEIASRHLADPSAKGNVLTVDGVHMNAYGNQMMATGILKALGLSPQQMASSKAAWNDLPGAIVVDVKCKLSINQYLQLQSDTAGENKPVDQVLSDDVTKAVQDRLNHKPPADSSKP